MYIDEGNFKKKEYLNFSPKYLPENNWFEYLI